MVEMYRNIAEFLGLIEKKNNKEVDVLPSIKESKSRHTNDKTKTKGKGSLFDLFMGPHFHTSYKSSTDCQVCRMLA